MRRFTLLAATAAFALASPALAATAKPQLGTFGFDTTGMDKTVKPGDDFFAYANGTWAKNTQIPADRSSYGGFAVLDDLSRERTREIIEAAAKSGAAGNADAQRVGTYYSTYMDDAGIEAKGIGAIKPSLDRIAAIATPADLARALGADQRIAIPGPFNVGVEQDPKSPDRYMVGMNQSGLGMPDRDYFLVDTPKFADTRAKYIKHIAAMFTLAGMPNAEARARAVFDLEKDMAQVQWSQVQNRDPVKTYNPLTPAVLATTAPGLDWATFLTAAGVGSEKTIDVAQPTAFTGMAKLVSDRPLAVWKDYLVLRTLKARSAVLPVAFQTENFVFTGTVLSGQPQIQPRWKRGVNAVNASMGEAVGQLYVAKYFSPDAKAKIDALVHNLLASMGQRIDQVDWMSPATKTQARAKLATFDPKIGYPSKWRDYSKLQVVAGDAVGNADRAAAFEYDRDLAKLGGPIDRTEWGMTPMTVNAYYNPPMNEIVFPAAILQAPFFDPAADPAVNYGAIGVVIGHEISHGFDDQGRQYDAKGALRDWWTPADATAFTARANKLIAQYDAYEPLPGTHIQGALTLGENIADLAGLRIAYEAYKLSLGGKPAPVIDGLTGDQRFFFGYAQVWRDKLRDESLLSRLTSDPHSPAPQRVYEVRNFTPWYDAFKVKPGEKLYLAPADRVRIW
ncbi:M13 family metallopeptidase [Glacieibacterium sp.]|uniref:M13 family metallopeptidase n=1 Tax=Glacieibacterium sp. TaxID=2860237 RepID=UPI003AFF6986